MKSFIVLAVCFAAALAAPASPSSPDATAQILRYDSDNIGTDGFSFSYETSNGIGHSEQAQLTNVGTENEGIAARGEYFYTGPDGVLYKVTYVADQNGFQPSGAHLPQ